MATRLSLQSLLVCLLALPIVKLQRLSAEPTERPNIVFILADDLGYGHLGCYGQRKIRTPHLDRLATEGMRFTQCYAGSMVCAPSRSVLMTGLHAGHTPIRANGSGTTLAPDDVPVAEVLKAAGYATGCFGKWGLGVEDTSGHPNRQGFDEFFGFLHQVHAHFYYPYFMWHNETRFPLPDNEGRRRGRYSHDEVHAHALRFIRANKDRPFFCYVPYTIPHVELVVPEESIMPYRGRWPETPLPDPRPGYIGADEPYATFAGMVSRMDGHVGEIMQLLAELKLDDNTIVFFTSDNGGQGYAWQRMTDFFAGNGPLRGYKGDFYEGGIRVPMIVRFPGRISPGSESGHVCAFWDVLPTLAEIAGAVPPPGLDGISFLPTLLGRGEQRQHESLYWEYPKADGLLQAARRGDWKLVRPAAGEPFELYNLGDDVAEQHNLLKRHPEIAQEMQSMMAASRTPARQFAKERPPGIGDFVR